jgi:hypothetical protein
LRTHSSFQPDDIFECLHPGCKKDFTTPIDMQEHLESHEQVQRFECQQCGHLTLSKKHLREHIVSHHSMIACDIPGCKFTLLGSNKLELQLHKNSVHSNEHHGCRFCGKGFEEWKDLEQHRINFHETRVTGVLKCSFLNCMLTFTSATDLGEHLVDKHWNCLVREQPSFGCDVPQCNLTFKSKQLLHAHKNTVHYRVQLWACQLCGVKFDNCLSRDSHRREAHKKRDRRIQRKSIQADTPIVAQVQPKLRPAQWSC